MKLANNLAASIAALLGSSAAWAAAPCATAPALGVTCYPPEVVSLSTPAGKQTYIIPAWTLGNYGTTAATVAANFSLVQYENFANNVHADAMVSGMTDDMIARLSTAMNGTAYEAPMLEAAAKRLSNTNLRRLQGAFGLTPLQTATIQAGVYASYKTTPKHAPIPGSQWWHGLQAVNGVITGTPVPVYSGQWLYDLFLDHYTVGLESVETALHQSMIYGQVKIHAGVIEIMGAVATALGIIQFFDPNAWADFKGWISEQYHNAQEALPSDPFVYVTPFPPGGGYPSGSPDPETSPTEMGTPGPVDMGVACHKDDINGELHC